MEGKILNDNLCFILERLAQNETIYKLLRPDSELFSEDLIHKNILTISRIPANGKGSYITVNFVNLIPQKNDYHNLVMRIDVLCGLDKSEWIVDGQVRCCLIIEEILKEMNTVELSGIGKPVLTNIEEIESSNEDFGGYALGYFCSTFEES